MTEYVFRAADSDSAMEKAIRELGEDAMILSVKRKGDVTEVRAVKESLAALPKVNHAPFPKGLPTRAVSLSEAMRSAENRRQDQNQQTPAPARPSLDYFFGEDPIVDPSPDPKSRKQRQPLPLDKEDDALFDYDTKINKIFSAHKLDINEATNSEPRIASTQQDAPEASEPLYPLMGEAVFAETGSDALLNEPAEIFFEPTRAGKIASDAASSPVVAEELNQEPALDPNIEPVLEAYQEPEPIFEEAVAPEPVIEPYVQPLPDVSQVLKLNGFSSHMVNRCSNHPDLLDLESSLTYACQELAAQLSVSKEKPTPLDSEILFIFGPSGAGKTTTAAKLAFARHRDCNIKPSLHAIGPKCFVNDTKLNQFSQLLDADLIEIIETSHIKGDKQVIVDCCYKDTSDIIQAYETLKNDFPNARVQPILTLPGTWSNLATEHYCRDIAKLEACTILTHLQISALGIAGFSALSEHKSTLLAASESDHVSDGIDIIDAPTIAHFLRETLSYTDALPYPA